MPLPSAQAPDLLHLVDLAGETDPLAALVVDESQPVLARPLDHPAIQWRLRQQLGQIQPRRLVAWGNRAFAVARHAVPRGIYRPDPSAEHVAAYVHGWRAIAESGAQLQRLSRMGWAARDCSIVPPPGVDALPRQRPDYAASREALRILPDDFIWLLSGDASRAAGLREAIWACTIMHVMQRRRRRHRMLLWGDGPGHRRARRFVEQLGQPDMCVATTRYPYHALTRIADAAVLLPHEAGSAWPAAVVALAGLPAVINARPAVTEVLGGRANARIAPGEEPRMVVREMLRLSESPVPRTQPDQRYSPERVRQQWLDAVQSLFNAASGR